MLGIGVIASASGRTYDRVRMGGWGAAFIGREHELDVLRRALAAARSGRGQVLLVEGEAGIGKSRLSQEAVSLAADAGFDVREGYCDDVVSARPFAPFAQALGISETSPDDDRRTIARLLASDGGDLPEVRLAISGKEFRVVELLGAIVDKLAEARPLLVLIEDLHWADSSTLAALRSIARRIRLLPVAIVATLRPGYEREELQRALDLLLREGATQLRLHPLTPEEVASLAAELLGSVPSAELLARLGGATGNPLFVREYVDALASGAEADALPVSFRLAVLRQTGQLSDETNDVLRVAAVLGATFAAADLAIALGSTSRHLTSLLQQAIQSGVVGERGERLAFRHDLVRDAIYEHIPHDLRRQLHREVGSALADADADPLVVAHHLALGAAGHDEVAAEWLRRAAHDVRLRAPGVAVALLERARDMAPPASAERDRLLAELVMPLAWSGRLVDAENLGLELLSRNPPPDVAGPLRCGLVYALTWRGRPREALAYIDIGDDTALSPHDTALLAAEAAVAYVNSPDLPAAAAAAERAETLARAEGHDLALCHALTVRAQVANFQGRLSEAVETCREAIEIADRSTNGEGHLAHPRWFPALALVNLDRVAEAQSVLQRGRQISEEMGLAWALPLYHSHLGACAFVAGDWDVALTEFETCRAFADDYGTNIHSVVAAVSWATVITLRRGDTEDAERMVQRALERRTGGAVVGFGLFNWARAMLAETKGDLAGALELLEPAWQGFFNAGARGADPWTTMALVRLNVKAGNRERAETVARAVEQTGSSQDAASGRALALRARGLVDGDAAVLSQALDAYRTSGRVADIADTCVDLGLCLLDAGKLDGGQERLDEAIKIFDDLGAARDIAQLRAELRSRGISRGSRRPRVKASTGWDSLTETEHKVVALVAQRMSNPEVAERLFVSRHTVESHLKNIYRKIGVGSRRELAAAASQRTASA
jgi:DNA-binding CsgD family transcriptional regulator